MRKRALDGFELHERIGLGSTAAVWRAEDRDGRIVAIKELHPHLAADADSVGRFEREAKIAATLRHPHIVQVVDWGCESGRWFIAFEHVDGVDLRRVLRDGPLPAEAALPVAIDLLSALAFAHDRGVIHRDVKPANVLLTRDGQVKLADFSIARDADLPAITMTGALVGTPAYMSPEQVWGREVDARADLWSAGLILWEMLAGRRPHEGPTSPEFLASSGPPPAPPGTPLFVGREIARSLETAPSERHESAVAFREALRAAMRLDGLEPDATSLAARVARFAPEPVVPPARRFTFAGLEAAFRRETLISRENARSLAGIATLLLLAAAPLVFGERGAVAIPPEGVEPPLPVEAALAIAEAHPMSTRVESRSAAATMLTVNTRPAGDVWIDGAYVGATPLWSFPVTPGRHLIAVRNGACVPRTVTVHAPSGHETEVDLSLACGIDPL